MIERTALSAVDIVRACLIEAGYPDAQVDCEDGDVWVKVKDGSTEVIPDYVTWRAFAVAGLARSCWPCYHAGTTVTPEGCGHFVDVMADEDD